MKRFVDSIAKQKGIKPPRGYTKSGSVCRGFLDQHASKNRDSSASGEIATVRPATAPICRDPKMAREPVAVEAAIGAVRGFKSSHAVPATRGHIATRSARIRYPTPPRPPEHDDRLCLPSKAYRHLLGTETPLRIPFGNKAAGRQLGRIIVPDAGMPRVGSTSRHSGNADGCDRHAGARGSPVGFPYPRTTPSVTDPAWQGRLLRMTNKDKSTATWSDVKAKLGDFDRAGLLGLVQACTLPARTTGIFCTPVSGWVVMCSTLQESSGAGCGRLAQASGIFRRQGEKAHCGLQESRRLARGGS